MKSTKPARSPSLPLSPSPSGKSATRFWLLKQEPTDFSFDDLWAAPKRTTNWEGVRNFKARNYLRDEIRTGDRAFFYHSNADPSAVVGIVEIVRDGYPDDTAFDKESPYYDDDADREKPRWFQVDVKAVEKLPHPVSLTDIKAQPKLASMALVRISQLSVQPVTPEEWALIMKLSRA